MAFSIVKFALTEVVINERLDLCDSTRRDALTELIRMERQEVQELNANAGQPIGHGLFVEFGELRRTMERIAFIKHVRTVLKCGLLEALVICKGLESHYDIKS